MVFLVLCSLVLLRRFHSAVSWSTSAGEEHDKCHVYRQGHICLAAFAFDTNMANTVMLCFLINKGLAKVSVYPYLEGVLCISSLDTSRRRTYLKDERSRR